MNRDILQMLAVGVATLVTLVLREKFPSLSGLIWSMFLGGIGALLFVELRKPVNYHAIDFSDEGFVFFRFAGMPERARWDEIVDVYFSRSLEPFINEMETEWIVHLQDGRSLTILVEFPHRRRFARELARRVEGFEMSVARVAMKSRTEGKWHCFQSPNPSFHQTCVKRRVDL